MNFKRTGLLILAMALSTVAIGQNRSSEEDKKDSNSILGALIPSPSKDRILGEILKGVMLESW